MKPEGEVQSPPAPATLQWTRWRWTRCTLHGWQRGKRGNMTTPQCCQVGEFLFKSFESDIH